MENLATKKIIELFEELGFTSENQVDTEKLKSEIYSLILEFGDVYE